MIEVILVKIDYKSSISNKKSKSDPPKRYAWNVFLIITELLHLSPNVLH